jgi:hypothetical protein
MNEMLDYPAVLLYVNIVSILRFKVPLFIGRKALN